MKKIIILFFILSSCKKEIYYYPSKSFFDENNPAELVVDNLSFEKITDSIRNGLYNDKELFIKIKDSFMVYNIAVFADTGGYRKERNGIYIRKDSLDLIKGMYPLNKLSKYLKLHYENNDREYFYASSYKDAYIMLVLERNVSSEKLIKLLLKIVKTYNETDINLKDSIQFNIILDYPLKPNYKNSPPPIPLY